MLDRNFGPVGAIDLGAIPGWFGPDEFVPDEFVLDEFVLEHVFISKVGFGRSVLGHFVIVRSVLGHFVIDRSVPEHFVVRLIADVVNLGNGIRVVPDSVAQLVKQFVQRCLGLFGRWLITGGE